MAELTYPVDLSALAEGKGFLPEGGRRGCGKGSLNVN